MPVGLGADSLGGAVNVITNRYKQTHVDVSYSFGSFDTHRSNINAVYVADLETGKYYPDQEVETRQNEQVHFFKTCR